MQTHILPALGRTALQQLTPNRCSASSRQAGHRPRPAHGRRLHAVLRTALGQAVKWNLIPRNVAALVDRPRVPQHELRHLTADEARQFLASVSDDRLAALYITAISLGLRRGEALGLHWEDVDLDKGRLVVRRAVQRVAGALQVVELKTKAAYRSINLPAVTVTGLRAHRARQLQERLLAGSTWQETGLVFTTRIGTPIDPRNYKRAFDRALERAGLAHMRIHDLRHTAASLLLAQGVSPKMISEILGHAG